MLPVEISTIWQNFFRAFQLTSNQVHISKSLDSDVLKAQKLFWHISKTQNVEILGSRQLWGQHGRNFWSFAGRNSQILENLHHFFLTYFESVPYDPYRKNGRAILKFGANEGSEARIESHFSNFRVCGGNIDTPFYTALKSGNGPDMFIPRTDIYLNVWFKSFNR